MAQCLWYNLIVNPSIVRKETTTKETKTTKETTITNGKRNKIGIAYPILTQNLTQNHIQNHLTKTCSQQHLY